MPKNQTVIIIGIVIIAIVIAGLSFTIPKDEVIEITTNESDLNETQQKTIEKSLEEIEKDTLENMEDTENSEYDPTRFREWITSGPFQIDRKEYFLGEKVFLRIGGLQDETGSIAFLRPLNETHYSVYLTIPFDAAKKQAFNYYIDPQLSKSKDICSYEDLVGEWAIVFRGTDYPNIKFTYLNQTIPGMEEDYYKAVC